MKNIDQFFGMARERHTVYLKRQRGERPPWTNDLVLTTYRFCNIFRELDKTTIWFRENIRDEVRDQPWVIAATLGFRWFNLISTGELIKQMLLWEWDSDKVREALAGKTPMVTGAYIIKTPNGLRKLEGICRCMDQSVKEVKKVAAVCREHRSLQMAHRAIMNLPYMGPFMAYEIVTDLRHTYLLEDATDINRWASAGPGCARGLGWLVVDNPDQYTYTSARAQARMLEFMVEILNSSQDESLWPSKWGVWEMREVEHTLCEYDKWRRGHTGERLKRRYR